MKTPLILLCLWMAQLGYAQITDNFDDSDLNVTPKWEGQLNNFITAQQQLRSNCSALNSSFYISTQAKALVQSEWRIDAYLLFNTSSLNYVDFILLSDSLDLLKMKNGYFVRMGGTTDEISLFKTKNGVETKIIDGLDNTLNKSLNQYTLIVKRLKDHSFILQRSPILGGLLITEGLALDSDILVSNYIGLRIKQSTASFVNKHFFDNLYFGQIIRDTVPPVMDSFVFVGPRQLRCVFNEDCDSNSLVDLLNYTITSNSVHPQSITYQSNRSVLLNFSNNFSDNSKQYLKIENVKDTSNNTMKSILQSFYYSNPDTASFYQLLITELMPDPNPMVGLPDKEYIEITNVSQKYIQLKGCNIDDGTGSKPLPNLILAPDSVIVLYNIPSLNNAGDHIWLSNQRGETIHELTYTDAWYRDSKKQNGGWSLEMINTKNMCIGGSNWMASIDKNGGTPGFLNSVTGMGGIDFQAPQITAIVALNDSMIRLLFDEEIDSIHSQDFTLFRNGRICSVKQTRLVNNYSGMDWLIDFKPSGDSIYLFSFSGVKDCSGNAIMNSQFELQWPSMADRNELIFNEVLFNPKSGGYDFIELYNNSRKAIDLSKHFIAVYDEQQQFKSIEKLSAVPLILKPNQYLLISENVAKVCLNYNCKNADALLLNYNKMPSMPDTEGNIILLNIKGQVIDSLVYLDDWHFPLLSDKEGVSLERISFINLSQAKDNWHSAASVAGFATPGYVNSQSVGIHGVGQYFSLQNTTVSPDDDGYQDVLILNYQLPQADYATTIHIYDLEGRLIQQWVNNVTLGTAGFLSWNGTDYNQQKAAIGVYIVMIESTHPSGDVIKDKISCVVAGNF